ncbi:hypothetical protein R1sor_025323 [Riccia sorocarpa]|uniref:Uncharacterized protein n=1 Tax=Riccia sorocarpa TaxID=122646 RepID=A0ABD3G8A7_9MARC
MVSGASDRAREGFTGSQAATPVQSQVDGRGQFEPVHSVVQPQRFLSPIGSNDGIVGDQSLDQWDSQGLAEASGYVADDMLIEVRPAEEDITEDLQPKRRRLSSPIRGAGLGGLTPQGGRLLTLPLLGDS